MKVIAGVNEIGGVVAIPTALAFSRVTIGLAESTGDSTATMGCVVAGVMMEVLVTVDVGPLGLVGVEMAVDWDADVVAVWLFTLAPPKLAMLLPKFCESTMKSLKSTVASPRKFPC